MNGIRKLTSSQDQAGAQMFAKRGWLDLRASQEGQQDAAEAGEEVDPDVGLQVQEVACQHANHDLHQGDGDADADGDQAGDQGETDPERRREVDVVRRDGRQQCGELRTKRTT